MSSSHRNSAPEKKKKIDYFEWIVWILAIAIVGMLAAHWVGLY